MKPSISSSTTAASGECTTAPSRGPPTRRTSWLVWVIRAAYPSSGRRNHARDSSRGEDRPDATVLFVLEDGVSVLAPFQRHGVGGEVLGHQFAARHAFQ